ncbi:beta-lactamase family protein [SAR86 cluster bacterium SAR86E]|uniref:Beta-lactamase family protein n=1 Tax=SAR86 cluster bacterium SAR86E TaxID=1208365 RepID=K6GJN4_9GAMM|nr:beta-lactamase family protein [SAR86 cluster bacterium SAR86E]
MQIIRGDDYQSWVYSNQEDLVVVDPWLTKKQVFPKYHWLLSRESIQEAYLIKNNLVKKVTHIIITAHFSDHLDLDSLKLFNNDIPIYTTFEASKVLAEAGFVNVTVVNIDGEYMLNSFKLKIFKAGKPYNTTTFAYTISNIRAKVFHEPHMFNNKTVIENVDACIVTVDMVKVFGLVQVSMGLDQARLVKLKLNAKYFIPTGIAPNRTKGFISNFLRIKEFYQQTSLLPASCQQVGDSLSL